MAGRKRSAPLTVVVAAVLALAAAPAPSAAVTLLVNGDTPSVRWQRVADRAKVATPPTTVNLHIARCPHDFGYRVAECIEIPQGGVSDMWLVPARPRAMRHGLLHGIGHEFDERVFTDVERERFRLIWRRPPIAWTTELRPHRPGPIDFGPSGIEGQPSAASEWFPDIYAWCAMRKRSLKPPRTYADLVDATDEMGAVVDAIVWMPGNTNRWGIVTARAMRVAYRRGVRTCGLIADTATSRT